MNQPLDHQPLVATAGPDQDPLTKRYFCANCGILVHWHLGPHLVHDRGCALRCASADVAAKIDAEIPDAQVEDHVAEETAEAWVVVNERHPAKAYGTNDQLVPIERARKLVDRDAAERYRAALLDQIEDLGGEAKLRLAYCTITVTTRTGPWTLPE